MVNIKYNFGILKNSLVQFNLFKDEKCFHIKGYLKNVKQTNDSFMFVFEDKTLEIMKDVFLHMKTDYKNEYICFIQTNDETNINSLFGFTMFDTFGFPYELSVEILEEQDLKLDVDGIECLKQFQKNKFKNTFKKSLDF